MERSTLLLGVGGLIAVIGMSIGGAYALGFFPTGGGGTAPPANTTNASSAPLSHTVENISNCGQTCRIMNATVTNQGNTTAANVEVQYRIYTGDEQVWRGNATVGTLAVNASEPIQKRIEVSAGAGLMIRGNDGNVLIRANVTSDQGVALSETDANVG